MQFGCGTESQLDRQGVVLEQSTGDQDWGHAALDIVARSSDESLLRVDGQAGHQVLVKHIVQRGLPSLLCHCGRLDPRETVHEPVDPLSARHSAENPPLNI